MFFTSIEMSQAEIEFQQHLNTFKHQIFKQPDADINKILADHGEDRALSLEHAWLGLKWKAEMPQNYIPQAIIKNLIIRDDNSTSDHFVRLTIQKDFATGKPIAVKEEIFIFEQEKKVLFLGRSVTKQDVVKLGVDPSELSSAQVLFDVEHAVKASGNGDPIATWKMVRQTPKDTSDPEEAVVIDRITQLVKGNNGLGIYLETLAQLTREGVVTNRRPG